MTLRRGLAIIACAALFIAINLTVHRPPRPCPARAYLPSEAFPRQETLIHYQIADAIPVFARKYGTSCQTCHVAFPRLTPFGQAFKNNAYRWPGEDRDPDFEKKDQPVALGAKAFEKEWPNAVWPGEIPGLPPVAFFMTHQYTSLPRSSNANDKNQFQGLGSSFEIISAGTLGHSFSFFGSGAFNLEVDQDTGSADASVELGRTYFMINPFEKPIFIAKIGRFDPHVTAVAISEDRALFNGYYLTTDRAIQDNGFNIDVQQGVEFTGFPGGRLGYTLGVVEGGSNPLNNNKDFYGRLEYKFGGLPLDGISDSESTSTKPWRDDSITIGGFGYLGFARISNAAAVDAAAADNLDAVANGADPTTLPAVPALLSQNDRFWIAGADLDINYGNFLADILYARQQNNQPIVGSSQSVSTNHLIGELYWVPLPWFVPGVKYEMFDTTGTRDQRLTFGSTFLIRANIKATLFGVLEKSSGIGQGFGDNPEIDAVLVAGF